MTVSTTSTLTDSISSKYVKRYMEAISSEPLPTYTGLAVPLSGECYVESRAGCLYCTTPYEGREVSCTKCGAPRKD